MPVPVLYRAFFGHVEFLDREAGKLEERGENGRELREYYQNTLGISAQNADRLKQQSERTLAAVRGIDQRIQAIIQAARAQFPGGQILPGQTLPQPPPELAVLDQDKEAATLQGIAELQGAVGDAGFEKIDRYLKDEFARNITSVPV